MPDMTWQDELAAQLAGRYFPQSTEEDRRAALGAGISRAGQALKAASIAGSWTKAAPFLMGAYGAGTDEFRDALGGIIKARQEDEDRVWQNEQRDYQYETMGEERAERGRKQKYREGASSQIGNLRTQFENLLADKDIDEREKAALSSAFSSAVDAADADPSPQSVAGIVSVLKDAAKAAGETEDFERGLTEETKKAANTVGLSEEEYRSQYLPKKLEDEELSRRELRSARGEAAEQRRYAGETREESRRIREINERARAAFEAGTPQTLPDGTIIVPQTPGISYLRPPGYGSGGGRTDAWLLKDKGLQKLLASPQQAMDIDEETAGILRNVFEIEPVENEAMQFSISAEDWQRLSEEMRAIQEGMSAPGGAVDGPRKTTTQAEIIATAKRVGKSPAEVAEDARRKGYTILP